ncbi:MAG: TerD family protein [Armatimonadetes bacterium]|nr:TerD family protein [Armatimonadota bacterium]
MLSAGTFMGAFVVDRVSLYFRRRGKVLPPKSSCQELLPIETVATLSINLEGLGYTLSPELLEACRRLSHKEIEALQAQLLANLELLASGAKVYRPMYLNFPRQVMEASAAQLYVNALMHYWSSGKLFPVQRKKLRNLLADKVELKYLELGSIEEFEQICQQLASSNLAFSVQDQEDIAWFVDEYGVEVLRLFPEKIPQKENAAVVSALLLRAGIGHDYVRQNMRTPTDALRLAVALSGGDVSLATASKFKPVSRPLRRLMLSLLEEMPTLQEEVLRRKNRWKRLGERLHPGEFSSKFPKVFAAFSVLRNDLPSLTFASRVELSIASGDVSAALAELVKRPGYLARRLDHLLRLEGTDPSPVLGEFGKVSEQVSTPVLLQAMHHFRTRNEVREARVFFPKGQVSKVFATQNQLPALSGNVCESAANICEDTLVRRFSMLSSMGKTYVDPDLENYPVPFATRSASKALRTLPKGSRLLMPEADTLRFFIWWKNGKCRTDIDLSAVMFDDNLAYLDVLSYYNLRSFGGCHSGDIVDAPNGASEFIDVSISKCLEQNVRYIAMLVNGYHSEPFVDLPECFAGWMARQKPESGEVFEAKTVQDRFDLAADTHIGIPIAFDLVERKAIWCDMALRKNPRFENNVYGNLSGIGATLYSMLNFNKFSLYDLALLHARSRGEIWPSMEGSDTRFTVASGLPFELERIGAELMA